MPFLVTLPATAVRRTLAGAAAAALLVSLAACGGNDAKATDSSGSSSSSSSSAAASSGSASGELTGQEFAGVLQKALDQATTAHMTMDLGKNMGTAEGDADYTQKPPAAAIKLSMPELGGDVEVRMVDGTLYLKSAQMGDKWMSASLDDPSSPLGALGAQLDVTKTMQTFADAVVSASDQGSEQVDGESLEHYKATVDTKKLLASMPSAPTDTGSLPKTMEQDWWFDGDGLVRKFSSDFAGQAVTLTLSNWGEDVSIEAPPADQVTAMPGNGAGGTGSQG